MSRKKFNGGLDTVIKGLDDLDKSLKIGFFESAKYDDSTPVAYVASVQEFGAPKASIPPRSFMRTTIAQNKQQWKSDFKKVFKRVVEGKMTFDEGLDSLGLVIAGQVRATIASIEAPPLSPITIALRNHKRNNIPIGGAFVGKVASAIANGETGVGQLGYMEGASTKPLVFDSIMLNALTHSVEKND